MEFTAYKKEVESLGIGKRLRDATYLHESAFWHISEDLVHFTSTVAAEYAGDLSWNVAKYSRRDFKISLLSYPTFLDDSYPALTGNITIDLVRGKSRKTDYSIYREIKNRFLMVRRARASVLGFCAREEYQSRPWISPAPDSRRRRKYPV